MTATVNPDASGNVDEVREIDDSQAPDRFARGWHCLGLVRDFSDGKPHSVQAFGMKLVIWKGEGDTINVIDAYCRHMGGDLSQGDVKDGDIACPFHDWRWNGKGRCTNIPYSRRVPRTARTKGMPTMQQDGMLFVFHDPENGQPGDELTPPNVTGYGEDGWTDWLWNTVDVPTNCREVVDNMVDMAHFFYIHYSFPVYFKNVFEGHIATQYMTGETRQDILPPNPRKDRPNLTGLDSVGTYYGPSYMITDLTYHYDQFDVEARLINCHYPVTPNSFKLQYGIIVKKNEHLTTEEAEKSAHRMAQFIGFGFEQDVAIWKNKARINNPLLCEEDGPVYQLRRWYDQFYVDTADVKPEMVERFEFEIDTSRPVEAWKQEVMDNIERNAALAQYAAKASESAAGETK